MLKLIRGPTACRYMMKMRKYHAIGTGFGLLAGIRAVGMYKSARIAPDVSCENRITYSI
jgi:hypothetical protein